MIFETPVLHGFLFQMVFSWKKLCRAVGWKSEEKYSRSCSGGHGDVSKSLRL